MIDENTAWDLIRIYALKALRTKMVWHSLVENAPYTLIDVFENYLLIQRLNGGEDKKLTKGRIVNAIKKLNSCNGRIKRGTLISPTVAEETAFVLFHPQLGWSDDGDYILKITD